MIKGLKIFNFSVMYDESRPRDQICGTLGEKDGRRLPCLREFADLSTVFCTGHSGMNLRVLES